MGNTLKEKQIEEMALTEVDILANDLNQHCADLAENYCGGITCLSCLAHALTAKGYHKASEVAREIFEEIEKMLMNNHIGHYKTVKDTWCYNFNNEIISEIAELKKKYTEEGK